jgi:cell division protein FtsN
MEDKKNAAQNDRKKVGILAAVCVLFIAIGYMEWTHGGSGEVTKPPNSEPAVAVPPGRPERAAKGAPDDPLATYDPEVAVAALEEFQARPGPKFERSPIDFGLTVEQKKAQEQAEEQKQKEAETPPVPPPPPPPPPITLKALGYEEAQGGARQAFITDCIDANCSAGDKEVDVYSVRAGEAFANRYKVLQITPTAVEVEDESGRHQKAQLPFPQ